MVSFQHSTILFFSSENCHSMSNNGSPSRQYLGSRSHEKEREGWGRRREKKASNPLLLPSTPRDRRVPRRLATETGSFFLLLAFLPISASGSSGANSRGHRSWWRGGKVGRSRRIAFFCGCRSRLARGVIREANTNDDFARLISLGCWWFMDFDRDLLSGWILREVTCQVYGDLSKGRSSPGIQRITEAEF